MTKETFFSVLQCTCIYCCCHYQFLSISKMHFQPAQIPPHSFVFSLNPVGWTLKFSLLSKRKCAAWVCLLTYLCCHVHASVPAMPGLQKNKKESLETEDPTERKPILALASWQKLSTVQKKIPIMRTKSCKKPVIYELILRCKLPREHTHMVHILYCYHQSQHYSCCWWFILSILCLWQLNFHSCFDNPETAPVSEKV